MALFDEIDETDAAVYATEAAMVDAAELIAEALEASGLSQADLARRLGVSRSEITARLRGHRNITIRSLAETLHALGAQLELGVLVAEDDQSSADSATTAYIRHFQHTADVEHEEHRSAEVLRMAFTQ